MHVVQSTEIDLGLLKKAIRINLALLKLKKGLPIWGKCIFKIVFV